MSQNLLKLVKQRKQDIFNIEIPNKEVVASIYDFRDINTIVVE